MKENKEEKGELTEFGSSIPVPSVQEMVKDPSFLASGGGVPDRYIRPEQDPPSAATSAVEVPVIDMDKLMVGSSDDQELGRLHKACQEWGFFQLVNHGVSRELVEKVKTEVKDLFNLPPEEKEKYSQRPGELEGFGQAFVLSDEQKLDWGDMFHVTSLPKHLRKPYLFPYLPLPLRDTLDEYSEALKKLAMSILNLMAKALGMDQTEMNELFEQGWQNLRLNYFPPCPKPEFSNENPGLQIKKQGRWALVTPLPDAFIVNVGDILEIISNGVYKSIEHRGTVNSVKERLSFATFLSPKLDGELGPAPSLVTPDGPAKFKRIAVKDYFKGLFGKELDGKSYLDMMRV
ncbi:Protein SRG1 [Linum grandiflorum]